MMILGKPIFNLFCLFFLLHLQGYFSPVDGRNDWDPHGNITIKWDVLNFDGDENYNAQVSIYNYQLFRHVEKPGWRLSWEWKQEEVIWSMVGAEAAEQGDCYRFKQKDLPHSCEKKPVIIDLLPGAPYTSQTLNCCKAGVLSTINQDPSNYGASFQMNVGNFLIDNEDGQNRTENNSEPITNSSADILSFKYGASFQMNVGNILIDDDGHHDPRKKGNKTDHQKQGNQTDHHMPRKILKSLIPKKFSLGVPGYTCTEPIKVRPRKFDVDRGRRHTQALLSWNIICTYSQTKASRTPTCCVSLSAFYNNAITMCPKCSCACLEKHETHCIDPDHSGIIEPPHGDEDIDVIPPKIRCTQHMCPIRVHWHVKTSYTKYWRVKMTVNNFNYVKNYSQWSLVVEHPNLQSVEEVYSFNYKPLNTSKFNDTGMFWGKKYYNELLLQSGDSGNVQTEFLLRKDPGFTFRGGFAFPRKIAFNGDICEMPPPDQFPRLPNSSFSLSITSPLLFSLLVFLLTLIIHGLY